MEIHKRLKKRVVILPLLVCLLVPILFTLSVKLVDRGEVQYSNSSETQEIGYANLNLATRQNYNASADRISDVLMVVGFLPLAAVGVLGLREVVRKKSLKISADYYIYALMMAVIAGIYLVFDHLFVLNYQPIFATPLKPSFPSTHTMIMIGISATSIIMVRKIVGNSTRKGVRIMEKIAEIALILGMIAMPVLRVFSGEHWLTDVAGGVIFGLAVAAIFALLVTVIPAKKR